MHSRVPDEGEELEGASRRTYLEMLSDRVTNKGNALRILYGASGALVACVFLSSLFTIEHCFYSPCVRGYGRDQLNRVHYGLTSHSLLTTALLAGQAWHGFKHFSKEEAKIKLSNHTYSILLGMMMAVIALDSTSFFLWDSYAWINWNLSITGDIPATADGAIFGENPGGHTLHYVKLYPAFRAQAIFSIMLGLLHMVTATLMLQWGRMGDEEGVGGIYGAQRRTFNPRPDRF